GRPADTWQDPPLRSGAREPKGGARSQITATLPPRGRLLSSFFGVTPQTAYYFNIQAGPGEAITQLVLHSTSSACCFETDNYSAIPSSVPGPIAGAGLPGLIFAIIGLFGWRRRRDLIVVT